MDIPYGKLYSGDFAELRLVTNRDGEVIDGFYQLTLVLPALYGDDEPMYLFATISSHDRSGKPTRVWGQVEALRAAGVLEPGTQVLAKITERKNEKTGYVNQKVVALWEAASLGTAARNGKVTSPAR